MANSSAHVKDKSLQYKSNCSSTNSINRSREIYNAIKEKKEYEKKIEVLMNRLSKLRQVEEHAILKVNKLKNKIYNEESTKLFKEKVHTDLINHHKKNLDSQSAKISKVRESRSIERENKEAREKVQIEEAKANYLKTLNERKEVEMIIKEKKEKEKNEKIQKYQIAIEEKSKFSINKKIRLMEIENEKNAYYTTRADSIVKNCEEMKEKLELLEKVEQEAIKKVNRTISAQEGAANELRNEISNVLHTENKYVEKEIKLDKLLNKTYGLEFTNLKNSHKKNNTSSGFTSCKGTTTLKNSSMKLTQTNNATSIKSKIANLLNTETQKLKESNIENDTKIKTKKNLSDKNTVKLKKPIDSLKSPSLKELKKDGKVANGVDMNKINSPLVKAKLHDFEKIKRHDETKIKNVHKAKIMSQRSERIKTLQHRKRDSKRDESKSKLEDSEMKSNAKSQSIPESIEQKKLRQINQALLQIKDTFSVPKAKQEIISKKTNISSANTKVTTSGSFSKK